MHTGTNRGHRQGGMLIGFSFGRGVIGVLTNESLLRAQPKQKRAGDSDSPKEIQYKHELHRPKSPSTVNLSCVLTAGVALTGRPATQH